MATSNKEELKYLTGLQRNVRQTRTELRRLSEEGRNVDAIYHSLTTTEGAVNSRILGLQHQVDQDEAQAEAEAKAKADAESKAKAEAEAKAKAEAAKQSSQAGS